MITHLRGAKNILTVTGAGISTASGIKPFRKDKDAVWEQHIMEKGTQDYFSRHPDQAWLWYLERFGGLQELQANPAHIALVALERWAISQEKEWTLITQNIDHLHTRAGAQDVIEIHGRSDSVRCPDIQCDFGAPQGSIPMSAMSDQFKVFERTRRAEDLPRCPQCSSFVRAHVLWFDEYYSVHDDFQWERAQEATLNADLIIFIGTSFSVGITEQILGVGARHHVPMFAIDPSPEKIPSLRYIEERAEVYLPSLIESMAPYESNI
jgi:NAD-dependent deacetylase